MDIGNDSYFCKIKLLLSVLKKKCMYTVSVKNVLHQFISVYFYFYYYFIIFFSEKMSTLIYPLTLKSFVLYIHDRHESFYSS